MKKRPCKWGRRVKGKCPRKPTGKRKAKPYSHRKRPKKITAIARKPRLKPISECPEYVLSRHVGPGDLREICTVHKFTDGSLRCYGGTFMTGENAVSEFDFTSGDMEETLSHLPKCPTVPVKRVG